MVPTLPQSLSFIESTASFRVSFKRGSTVFVHVYLHCIQLYHIQSAWMILETVSTFASTLVDEVAIIGFWRQCISQQDDTSGTHAHTLRAVVYVLQQLAN